jgi:polyphosphate kinase
MKQVERDVLPLLTPIAVGPSAPFPHMPSLSLNVGGRRRRARRAAEDAGPIAEY